MLSKTPGNVPHKPARDQTRLLIEAECPDPWVTVLLCARAPLSGGGVELQTHMFLGLLRGLGTGALPTFRPALF